jgi:hypothetical protein
MPLGSDSKDHKKKKVVALTQWHYNQLWGRNEKKSSLGTGATGGSPSLNINSAFDSSTQASKHTHTSRNYSKGKLSGSKVKSSRTRNDNSSSFSKSSSLHKYFVAPSAKLWNNNDFKSSLRASEFVEKSLPEQMFETSYSKQKDNSLSRLSSGMPKSAHR